MTESSKIPSYIILYYIVVDCDLIESECVKLRAEWVVCFMIFCYAKSRPVQRYYYQIMHNVNGDVGC